MNRKQSFIFKISKVCTLFLILWITIPAFGYVSSTHPRLLFNKVEEKEVKKLIKKDPLAGKLASFLKEKADSMVVLPQLTYDLNKYGNILYTSRAYVTRLGTLSLAYRLYGEQKYLDAVNKTLLWICDYKDWDPKHFLDTAEMTTAVAIAYDWLFDALPESTRQKVKESIYKNAISIVLREYEKGGPGSWAKRETNWNVV